MLVTSATLRDAEAGEPAAEWAAAEARVGASHLPSPAIRVTVASPFDYGAQTRAFVVTDVNARDLTALAGAYRALFLATGGGGLGLFTAIARLRAVHARIAPALRMVVFERVPWLRPDILHRERRVHLSDGDPAGYDDRIVRLRLRQAFRRLIRNATDRGVFLLLDRQTPSRLLTAFPPGVVVERVGLAQAVAETRAFLE